MDQKVKQERDRNRARYTPIKDEPEEIDYRTDQEKQDYTNSAVKKLIYQMFEYHRDGKQIFDFGNPQYKYLVLWGLIPAGAHLDFIKQADNLATLDHLKNIGTILTAESRVENIESLAKTLAVKAYSKKVKNQGVHISVMFQDQLFHA